MRLDPRELVNSTVSSWSELRRHRNIRVDDEVRIDSAGLQSTERPIQVSVRSTAVDESAKSGMEGSLI